MICKKASYVSYVLICYTILKNALSVNKLSVLFVSINGKPIKINKINFNVFIAKMKYHHTRRYTVFSSQS